MIFSILITIFNKSYNNNNNSFISRNTKTDYLNTLTNLSILKIKKKQKNILELVLKNIWHNKIKISLKTEISFIIVFFINNLFF